MPDVPFAQKMASKTNCGVLSVLKEDPSTTNGMVKVCQTYQKYVPVISDCENVRAKVLVQGNAMCRCRCRCRCRCGSM